MTEKYTKISIVMPVFNEKRTIKKIIDKVMSANVLELEKELVIVDDGSSDGTREILAKIRNKSIKKILLDKNYGKGYALRQGFVHTSGEITIVQDADLEYNPDDYPLLITPFLAQDAKAVFGSRELNINSHSYRSYFFGGKLVTLMTRLLFGGRLTDVPTGYKAIQTKILKKLNLKCVRFEFCPEVTALLLKNNINIVEVPVRYKPRTMEEGKKIRVKDGIEAITTLLRVRLGI